jgi:hypothetical protein
MTKNRDFLPPQLFYFSGWTGFGGGDEKGENGYRFGGTLLGAVLSGSIPKAKPRPKAVCSGQRLRVGR